MKFSILICTIDSRKRFLQRLMDILTPQITNDIEVVIEKDNGEASIGAKRNRLLDRASGDFLAFIDDDDRVSTDYCKRILNAIKNDSGNIPDCIGMEGIITFDGRNPKKFIHSLKYKEWFERGGIFYRNPNHLSPIKREHAIKVKFPEINKGEDHEYSKNILQYLKTEVYLENPIYFYDYITYKPEKA